MFTYTTLIAETPLSQITDAPYQKLISDSAVRPSCCKRSRKSLSHGADTTCIGGPLSHEPSGQAYIMAPQWGGSQRREPPRN